MDYKARAALERVRKALMMRDAGYDAAPDAEDCALLVAALTPPAERESLQGMIAAIYAGLDADDRAFVDCQWREYRRAEFSATPPVEPKTFPNYNLTGLGGECTNALPTAPAILSDLAPLYATPPAETGESDLSYVPIVGAGVDALDRRDPEAMAKISKQLKSWKCWPTTPPAQAETGEDEIAQVINPVLMNKYRETAASGQLAANGRLWADVRFGKEREIVLAQARAILAKIHR